MAFDPKRDLNQEVYDAYKYGPLAWPLVVKTAVQKGQYNVDWLTNVVFYLHHPERNGRKIETGESAMAAEWNNWRILIKPMVPAMAKPEGKTDGAPRTVPYNVYALQKWDDAVHAFPNAAARTWYGDKSWTEIVDLDDLIRLVKRKCGSDGYVKNLRIGGHGSHVSFRIGITYVSRTTIGGLENRLRQLSSYLRPGRSLVLLDHCGVGNDTALMRQFAKALGGVAVIGPLDSQYTNDDEPQFEGPANICGTHRCIRIASPNMSSWGLREILYTLGEMHPDEKARLKKEYGLDVE